MKTTKTNKPRYLDILDPVYKAIAIPRDEQIPKTCPVCDYAIAWNKQKAGIFINCCHCFYAHDTPYIAVFGLIKKLRDLVGDFSAASYFPEGWEKLTIPELQVLKTNLISAIAGLEDDDQWEDM